MASIAGTSASRELRTMTGSGDRLESMTLHGQNFAG